MNKGILSKINTICVLELTNSAKVLALCLAMTEKDIHKYQNWKNGNRQGAEV